MEKKIDRERFLKYSGTLFLAGAAGLWYNMISVEEKLSSNIVITLPFNPNSGVHFYRDFIFINNGETTEVFSSHCTHLGCIISEENEGKLVCPCHGSAFDEKGNPLKGPANKPLKKLDFTIENDKISVKL